MNTIHGPDFEISLARDKICFQKITASETDVCSCMMPIAAVVFGELKLKELHHQTIAWVRQYLLKI